jgi:uncharacterized protein (DUF433 family)
MRVGQIINVDKEVIGGIPVTKGTRVPIKNLSEYLEAGDSIDNFLADFDYIPKDDCLFLLKYSAQLFAERQLNENTN